MPFRNELKMKIQFIEDIKQKRQERETYVEVSTLSGQMSQRLVSNACWVSQTTNRNVLALRMSP